MRALASITLVAIMMSCAKAERTTSDADDAAKPSGKPACCDHVIASSTCDEYTAVYVAENKLLDAACAKGGGTFALGAECPNGNMVGDCAFSRGQVRKYYGRGGRPFASAAAKQECEQTFFGTWRSR